VRRNKFLRLQQRIHSKIWPRDLIKNLATDYEANLTLGHEETNLAIIMLTNDGKLLIFNSIKNDKTFHLNHRD
jgi:hypothetical protein